MPRCEQGSVHSSPRHLGNTATDVGDDADVCAICANFEGFDDL